MIKDLQDRYCRMLGHDVGLSYCLKPGSEVFCRKIVDCWAGKFDIQEYIKKNYSTEEIQRALNPPKPKIASLVELIQKSKEAVE